MPISLLSLARGNRLVGMGKVVDLNDGEYLGANMHEFLIYPWKMIDYWLYLTHAVERGRTSEARLDGAHLLTTNGFFQIDFDELRSLRTVPGSNNIVFTALPVPSSGLPGRKIVLGFDLTSRHLQGRLVDYAPERFADLGQMWSRSELIIDIQADRFPDILEYTLNGHLDILRVGMIGYFQKSTRELHSALDLVIAIQFGQFLRDFAELLGGDKAHFTKFYQPYDEQMRDLLQKASTKAWFGARDGLSIGQYRLGEMDEFVSFDLFDEPSDVPRTQAPKPVHLKRPEQSQLLTRSLHITEPTEPKNALPDLPAQVMRSFTAPSTAIPAMVLVMICALIAAD
ncbi:uncharacterized protein N7498_004314 [Penicillium cinerascens]|uniref:Uncharacterized protein n=1 Tax=Penicillium cinerascens TaxID=70096 RepID=A0A9W9N3T3_9EURO|nr:uncharacterized protein N7498_004314 [Penicillium cinerascens]KAJ5212668.1 hypothetical protein N7498_004314 [Penicillium cinerascens]